MNQLRMVDPSPVTPVGVDWEQAVRIATVLKSWDRPKGLIFVISIDARSPDDNRVFLSIDMDSPGSDRNTLVLAIDRVPSSDVLSRVGSLIRDWFGITSTGD